MSIQAIDETSLLQAIAQGGAASDSSFMSSITGGDESSSAASADQSVFAQILIAKLDKNGDGEVSAQELKEGARQFRQTLQQLNGISSQMRASEAQASASELLAKLSKNGSASLDITDTGLTQIDFTKIDSNTDGQLSKAELQAVIDKAAGKSSSTSVAATQEECSSILSELQGKSLVKQYEVLKKAAAA